MIVCTATFIELKSFPNQEGTSSEQTSKYIYNLMSESDGAKKETRLGKRQRDWDVGRALCRRGCNRQG